MKKLTLYRGITVSENQVESVIEDIRKNGLNERSDQQWGCFVWKNLKSEIDIQFNKPDLNRTDTSPASILKQVGSGSRREFTEGEKSICFADKIGAMYYATKHNVTKDHKIPVLITADIAIDNIAIDGRDFLYTVFGFIDINNTTKTTRQIEKLTKIYGDKIKIYIEKMIKHPLSEKYAICDLVTIDNEIIEDHSKNKEIIGGRYGTLFKSAFFVKIPVIPENIRNVEIIEETILLAQPTMTLNDILER